jgi:hypothetical protein
MFTNLCVDTYYSLGKQVDIYHSQDTYWACVTNDESDYRMTSIVKTDEQARQDAQEMVHKLLIKSPTCRREK